MPFTPRDQTKPTALTAAINEIRRPNQFIRRLLYSNEVSLPVEDIELSYFDGQRKTLPLVRRSAEGTLVDGVGFRYATVAAPNIRVKMAFTGDKLMYQRQPGMQIYGNSSGDISRAVQQAINRDLAYLEDQIVNTIEWMCAQALQNDIVYSVSDKDSFRITYPRDGAYNITLLSAESWDNADATLPRPLANIHTVKRLVAHSTGVQITDAICGVNAANAILELAESGNLPAFKTDSGVRSGNITFASQFNEDGAIFLGEMGGVRFWEYSRTVLHNGSSVPMIRDDYVEFVSLSAASERTLYYGSIPDIEALQGRSFVGPRFAKSWITKDPASQIFLVHTRPLPVNRRPNATVSMKVTNN